jgi:hypothetical protein
VDADVALSHVPWMRSSSDTLSFPSFLCFIVLRLPPRYNHAQFLPRLSLDRPSWNQSKAGTGIDTQFLSTIFLPALTKFSIIDALTGQDDGHRNFFPW